jgi:hypothetical protein
MKDEVEEEKRRTRTRKTRHIECTAGHEQDRHVPEEAEAEEEGEEKTQQKAKKNKTNNISETDKYPCVIRVVFQ